MENGNLSNWTEVVQSGVGDALRKVVVGVPDVLAAIVVFLIGVVVGVVLKGLLVRLLRAIKLGSLAKQVRLETVFPGKYDVVELLGDLVKWFFIIVFMLQAFTIAHVLEVNNLVQGLLHYVPSVIAAAFVLFAGGVVADLTSRLVVNAARAMGASVAGMLGNIAKYAIWAVVTFTALAQLGVNTIFLDRLFTAVVVMLALAGGLAFGLGGRDMAADVLDRVRKGMEK
jgi:hypothetical protein